MMRVDIPLALRSLALALALLAPAAAARANAPAGQYTVSSSTVVDNRTHLTWYKTVGANLNHDNAVNYCGLLGAGWRLPSVKELQTLIDDSQPSPPRLDTTAFPGAPSTGFYSTSTTYPGDATLYYYVNFYTGNTGYESAAAPHNVLCVH